MRGGVLGREGGGGEGMKCKNKQSDLLNLNARVD